MSVDKEWTFEEAMKDYATNFKSCNNCKFGHQKYYLSCRIKGFYKKIYFPRLKAKHCKYYNIKK